MLKRFFFSWLTAAFFHMLPKKSPPFMKKRLNTEFPHVLSCYFKDMNILSPNLCIQHQSPHESPVSYAGLQAQFSEQKSPQSFH